ncbi:MAG: hypothetical protein AAGA92_16190 [Planctomycetota bacterium]
MNKTALACAAIIAAAIAIPGTVAAWRLTGPAQTIAPNPTPAFSSELKAAAAELPCELVCQLKACFEQVAACSLASKTVPAYLWQEKAGAFWRLRFGVRNEKDAATPYTLKDAAPGLNRALISEFAVRFPESKKPIDPASAAAFWQEAADAL